MLDKFATEEVKANWLPKMIKGEKVLCLALTEPHAGSDAAVVFARTGPETRARGIRRCRIRW